jgi:hypothetical protein
MGMMDVEHLEMDKLLALKKKDRTLPSGWLKKWVSHTDMLSSKY